MSKAKPGCATRVDLGGMAPQGPQNQLRTALLGFLFTVLPGLCGSGMERGGSLGGRAGGRVPMGW